MQHATNRITISFVRIYPALFRLIPWFPTFCVLRGRQHCGKVDTSRYFLKRLIGTCGLVVLYGVAMSFATSMLPAVFIGIAGIAYQILRVQDDDSSKTERAVLMLSDPAIHLTVFWGIQWVSEFVKTE